MISRVCSRAGRTNVLRAFATQPARSLSASTQLDGVAWNKSPAAKAAMKDAEVQPDQFDKNSLIADEYQAFGVHNITSGVSKRVDMLSFGAEDGDTLHTLNKKFPAPPQSLPAPIEHADKAKWSFGGPDGKVAHGAFDMALLLKIDPRTIVANLKKWQKISAEDERFQMCLETGKSSKELAEWAALIPDDFESRVQNATREENVCEDVLKMILETQMERKESSGEQPKSRSQKALDEWNKTVVPKIKDFDIVSKNILKQTYLGSAEYCTLRWTYHALGGITRNLDKLAMEHYNEDAAEIITAKPLTSAQFKTIEKKLLAITGYSNLRLSQKVSPSIIGGIIVAAEAWKLDLSIDHILLNLAMDMYGVDKSGKYVAGTINQFQRLDGV